MSACYCSWDDGEPTTFSRQQTPIARKEHRCGECRETIKPGERYQLNVWGWAEGVDSFKTCMPCTELRAEINAAMPDDLTVCFGSLGCAYVEMLREGAKLEHDRPVLQR